MFNTAGHLELAVYKSNPQIVGGAGSLFGLGYRDPVSVQLINMWYIAKKEFNFYFRSLTAYLIRILPNNQLSNFMV